MSPTDKSDLVRYPRADGRRDRSCHPPVGMNVYIINRLARRRAPGRNVQGRDSVPDLGRAAHRALLMFPIIPLYLVHAFPK